MPRNIYIRVFPNNDVKVQNIYGAATHLSSIFISDLQSLEKDGNKLFYVFGALKHEPVPTTAAFIAELTYRTDELNS